MWLLGIGYGCSSEGLEEAEVCLSSLKRGTNHDLNNITPHDPKNVVLWCRVKGADMQSYD